jgi:hypothetical protein
MQAIHNEVRAEYLRDVNDFFYQQFSSFGLSPSL